MPSGPAPGGARGGAPAVVFDGCAHGAEDFEARVVASARFLLVNARVGDRVALWLPNGIELLALCLAGLRTGVVPMPLAAGMKPPEVRDVLAAADVALLVAPRAAGEALGPLPSLRIRAPDDVPAVDDGAPSDASSSDLGGDAPALVLHTSGTQGRAKAVVLSRAAVDAVVRDRVARTGLSSTSVLLTASCLTQSVGLYQALAAISAGATLVLLESYDLGPLVAALHRHRPTHLLMAVEAFDRLLHDPRVGRESLRSVAFACAGADRVTARVQDRFHALTGRALAVSYGLTESSWVLFNRGDRPDKRLALGRPGPDVEVAIRRGDGTEAASGEVGEVVVRSPRTMLGYLFDEPANREAFSDGRLATGDLAYRDADGWYWFAGRKKNLVVLSSGDNVSPVEVENAILGHPAVSHCAVAGAAAPDGTEVPWAYVVRRDASLSREELLGFLRERLSDWKLPRRIEFVPELSVGPTGKVVPGVPAPCAP